MDEGFFGTPREVAEAQFTGTRHLTDTHYQDNQTRIQSLQERLDRITGHTEGTSEAEKRRADAKATLYTVLALILTVAVIISPHIR